MVDSNILDMSLREWIEQATVKERSERITFFTTPEVAKRIDETVQALGGTANKSLVVHLSVLFGLAALTKYWEETGDLKGDGSEY
jgi:hypothetical protein